MQKYDNGPNSQQRNQHAGGAVHPEQAVGCHHTAQQANAAPAPLAPWETAFWAERLRRARYDFDEEQLRPYFPLPGVLAGLFEITGRVFGIRVTERPAGAVEAWHAEVKFYDVHDRSGRHLGSFYTDWHPRESKRGGAWMNYLLTGGPVTDPNGPFAHQVVLARSTDGLAITEGDVVIVQVQPLSDNPYEDYESFDLVTLEAFDESIMQVAPSIDVDKFAVLGGKVGKTSVRVKINGDEVDIIDAEVLAQPEVGP